jgi:plasmid stability protein
MNQSVTLNLPAALYDRLRRMAEEAHRSVEDELLDVVVAAVPEADELPADLAEAVAQLAVLDDAALMQAATAVMPPDAAEELEHLHSKRQREGLTEPEAQAAAALTRLYERTMLVRAEAAALLAERGRDVSGILGAA